MANYDPTEFQKLADRLQKQAVLTVYFHTVAGAAIGALLGCMVSMDEEFAYWWAGVVPGALLGIRLGLNRSLQFKLQAQTALCQMKIEENTRKP